MDILKFDCPKCGKQLGMYDAPGVRDRMIACPHCKFRAKVSVFLQHDDTDTQIVYHGMNRTIGSLYLGNKEYSLHKGENSIGRKAQTGHAEVQLCDEWGEVDMYMSKKHAFITIKEGVCGLEHQLRPWDPKNIIKVNGKTPLMKDDVIVLQWGDKLTFGHTELVFDRPSNGERTMIDNATE